MNNQYPKYFLGANSCEGFVSHFSDCYRPEKGWHAFIIKGGPGTGKSSFMKHIAYKAGEAGLGVELCVCSSDPMSLDGVIIRDKKTVLLDGTAPHIIEPKYPGACEEIINLGEYWDNKKLALSYESILEATDKNKAFHKSAAMYLSTCGELIDDNILLSASCTNRTRVLSYADFLKRKYIPRRGAGEGMEWIRFIEGITPCGVITYNDTVTEYYNKKIIIDDKYGAVSNIILEAIRSDALNKGYEIITIRNPWLPSKLIDHILIPELSLCFVTENEYVHFNCNDRRIHSRRFIDASRIRTLRSRMLFNRRITKELISSAVSTLSKAKLTHDILEKYYSEAMNFHAVTALAQKTAALLTE